MPKTHPMPSSAYRDHLGDVVTSLREKGRKILSNAFIFDALPKPIKAVRTDSEGKFELSVDRISNVVIAARASRNNGNTEEEYYWVLPLTRPAGDRIEITLSNDNLLP